MEGKLFEYYKGNPDTVYEYDDYDDIKYNEWHYNSSDGITFGWFQTSLDGGKEFISEVGTCHYDLCEKLTFEIAGKAVSNKYVKNSLDDILNVIYSQAAYIGRTFTEPKVITTWHKVSSRKLAEIIDLLGGIGKFKDYYYVFPREYGYDGNDASDEDSVKVINYINSNNGYMSYVDERKMKMNIRDKLPEKLVNILDNYNQPSQPYSKLADKTSKLGKMTIAQYNSLIHQEGKEHKNTIKENNMENKGYKKEFSTYIGIMNEALKRNDFKTYDSARRMLDETIDECKNTIALENEVKSNNFGILNHIFEQCLPRLIKTNKKAVKNVIKTIKEDKNLIGQFNFYNVIQRKLKGNAANIMETSNALEKLADMTISNIDQKTVRESNKKLRKVMVENKIVPTELVDEESRKLYESCDVILTKKRSAENMLPLMESYDSVRKYVEKHKNDNTREVKNIDEMIGDFEDKLKTNLNESEMSFIKQITDFKTPIAEKRREKLFNTLKEDCLSNIKEMMEEDSDNIELKSLDEKINGMKFSNETIIGDIAKLLEIRDILLDK